MPTSGADEHSSLAVDVEQTLAMQADGINRLSKSVQSLHAHASDDWAAKRVLDILEEAKPNVRVDIAKRLHDLELDNGSEKEAQAITTLQRLPLSPASIQIQRTSTRSRDFHEVDTVIPILDDVAATKPFASQRHLKSRQKQRPTVSWQVAVHKFPIGVLTVFTRNASISNEQRGPNSSREQTSWSLTLTLFPARWIAQRALRLSIASIFPVFGAPSLTWSLDQAAFNDDPQLLSCLKYCDVDALVELFQSGRARPTDIIAPWGNSLLHVRCMNQLMRTR